MEMAGVVSNLLATMDDLKAATNRHLLSDLAVAAVLADATARAARYTVRINVGELADATRRSELLSSVDRMVQHCTVHRTTIESFVREHLEGVEQPGR
jgi:formiminotetrahydrofolate cyclodeaminase